MQKRRLLLNKHRDSQIQYFLLLLMLFCISCSNSPTAYDVPQQRHIKWPIGTKYSEQGFWEYLPREYETRENSPLIVFLHGLGENGNGNDIDLNKILNHGPPTLINQNTWLTDQNPTGDVFIVLSPQNSKGDCHQPDDVHEFLTWAIDEYNVDETRVYLTGLSCGGIGVWNYLEYYLHDDIVAAVVPIAGDGIDAWTRHGCDLGKIPIWAFHGDLDDVIDVEGTNIPMDGLANCSSTVDARKTIYNGIFHDSWSFTYSLGNEHDIYQWMLSHEKSE